MALLAVLLNGFLMGSIYAVLASGLNLAFGGMREVNLAHPALAIIAALISNTLFRLLGLDPLLSLLILIVPFFLLGYGIQATLLNRMKEKGVPLITTMLLFTGILMVVKNTSLAIWSADFRFNNTFYAGTAYPLGGLNLSLPKMISFGIAVVVLGFTVWFIEETDYGRAIRALTENRDVAKLMGINVSQTSSIILGLATALAAAGGILMSFQFSFYPGLGDVWRGRLFTVIILGGLGNIRGSIVSGFIFGVLFALFSYLLSATWAPVIVFGILITTLMVKPEGLLGRG